MMIVRSASRRNACKLAFRGCVINRFSSSRPSALRIPLALLCAGGVGICSTIIPTESHCEGGADCQVCEPDATDSTDDFSMVQKCLAEAIGTGIIVSGGCGAVAAMKYAGGTPIKSPAVAFGSSVALAVYLTGHISGAHLNPAVTVSLAVNKPDSVSFEMIGPYIASQCAGATVAGALNYATFRNGIASLEASQNIVRGTGAASAAIFDGAFGMIGNPGLLGRGPMGLLFHEIGMTAVLAFAIFGITDPKSAVPSGAEPALIGLSVATLIGVYGPVTGCGMNPARDLGPRLVTSLVGWGSTSLTPGWWAFTAGPVAGAVLGGAVYTLLTDTHKSTRKK